MNPDDIPQWITDLRFWEQIHHDAKRTLFCSPTVAPWVQALVDLHDRGDTFTVEVSPIVGDNQVIVADLQAMETYLTRPRKPDFRAK